MKRTRIFRMFTNVVGVVLLLGLATAPALKAEFECKQELMAGAWIGHSNLNVLEGSLPFSGGPFSEVNLMVLDEQGRASFYFQTSTTTIGALQQDFLSTDDPIDVQVTINPDCRGTWVFTNRASGVPIFEFDTMCANGQRECFATWTQSFGNTNPTDFIGIVTLKKVDAFDQQLEAKVDALAAELSFVKDLAKRLAATHGVLRREDVDR